MDNKRIAVVDDEHHIVQMIRVHLERAGYEVLEANDGVAGLELIEKERPDLAVIDVMMPKMDGFELLKKIQENPELEGTPVIMLTAKSDLECPHCGRGRQFNPRELVQMVNGILSDHSEPDI